MPAMRSARPVKPFVLVVAKDTDHAAQLKAMISLTGFFEGRYADKVMEIHSNQTGRGKGRKHRATFDPGKPGKQDRDRHPCQHAQGRLGCHESLHHHPLRTSASETLTEQTIGRGLRLPYGKRTGNDKVDKLTIVAHDKFQRIIEEANKPDSIISKKISLPSTSRELKQPKEVIVAVSRMEKQFAEEQEKIAAIAAGRKAKGPVVLDTKKALFSILPELNVRRLGIRT